MRVPIHKGFKRALGKTERDVTSIDSDGEVLLLLPGFIGFRLDPLGIDGLFGPHDNRTARGSEFLSNHCVKRSAGGYVAVLPDRPAMRLQHLGERVDPWAVFTGITDEDVTHRQCPGEGPRPLPGRGLVKKPYGLV